MPLLLCGPGVLGVFAAVDLRVLLQLPAGVLAAAVYWLRRTHVLRGVAVTVGEQLLQIML